ncbi:MAG: hypothetical protein GTO13_02105 [Proteobacteria bacterium]|nr:hypothetical protein [Pseudomonadota bacterium]
MEYGRDLRADELHGLQEEMRAYLREHLRVNPEIELVPPDSIPRETQKAKLIEIQEKDDSSFRR